MSERQKRRFILQTLFCLAVAGWVIFAVKIAIPYTLPFFIGLGIAFMLRPVTVFLSERLRWKRRIAAIFVMSLFYLLLALLFWAIFMALFAQISTMVAALPDFYLQNILPILAKAIEALSRLITRMVPDAADFIANWFDRFVGVLEGLLAEASHALMTKGSQIAGQLPLCLLTTLVTVLCSVLIAQDYSGVASFLLALLPSTWRAVFWDCKAFVVHTLFRLCKAYMKIMLITFAELSCGFLLLGIENPIGKAAVLALADLLPLIGSGGILVPWGLFALLGGRAAFGGGLLLLSIGITIVRNLIEPKIVGKSIGLHPLITIVAMYIGLRLFGIFGVFLAPLVGAFAAEWFSAGSGASN